MSYWTYALAIGIGATAVMDLWGIARTRLLRVPAMNYGLIGRWLANVPRERFRRDRIAASPPVRGESAIGWAAHYLIGIVFAAILLAIFGIDWVRHPTIGPALIVGIGSVAAPLLLMPPLRIQSFVTHSVFGLGLYVAAWATSSLLTA
jgi:hypothetical protein